MGFFKKLKKSISSGVKDTVGSDVMADIQQESGHLMAKSKLWSSAGKSGTKLNTGGTAADARAYTIDQYTPGDSTAEGKAKDQMQAQQAEISRQAAAQEAADRNAQGVLIRRRRNRADPTKGGTLLTGALGLSGSGAGTKLGVV